MIKESFRAQPPKRQLPNLLRKRMLYGVSRLINATPMDRLGIPVVSAMRPNTHDAQITVCQGKGVTLRSACVGALMEAIERHSANASYPMQTSSLAQMEQLSIEHICPEQLGLEWPRDAILDWVDGMTLGGACPIALPAGEMLFPYVTSGGIACPVLPSTTGISAGNSYDDAIFHALLEVVERYSTSLYRSKINARLVDTRGIQKVPRLSQLLDCYTKQDIEWFILDLSEPVQIPVFMFISYDPHSIGPNRLVAGQAAHVVPERALESAILECAQSRIVALQASREDLHRHADDWLMIEHNIQMEFEMLRRAAECVGTVSFSDLVQQAPAIHAADPLALCDQIGLYDTRKVQWFDLSQEKLAVKVVSVRADGFSDFYVDPRRAPTC
ncbi:MAG: YcaO-like family protein [Arenicellales bacterium]